MTKLIVIGLLFDNKKSKKVCSFEKNYQIHEKVSKPIIDCVFNL
jgi:hypothetical protein